MIKQKAKSKNRQFIQYMGRNCFGAPHRLLLDPLLFNIFLADFLFIINSVDIANFEDVNTPYATDNYIDGLIDALEEASKSLFTWFDNNLMKSNAGKCHLLVSSNEKVTVKIDMLRSHQIFSSMLKLFSSNFRCDHVRSLNLGELLTVRF